MKTSTSSRRHQAGTHTTLRRLRRGAAVTVLATLSVILGTGSDFATTRGKPASPADKAGSTATESRRVTLTKSQVRPAVDAETARVIRERRLQQVSARQRDRQRAHRLATPTEAAAGPIVLPETLRRWATPTPASERGGSIAAEFERALHDAHALLLHLEETLEARQDSRRLSRLLEATREDLIHNASLVRERFAQIDEVLRDDGAPEDARRRHREFVAEFEQNLDEVQRQLGVVVASSENDGPTLVQVQTALSSLQPKMGPGPSTTEVPPRPQTRRPPVRARVRIASPDELDAAMGKTSPRPVASSKAPPTAADLAANLDVQLTPEIQALAAQLATAAGMYEFVYDNIDFNSYFGSRKGSHSTLTSGRGNAHDQASLLIALLRAGGIPARYASGTVDIPIADAMNWLGARDGFAAGTILATAGISATVFIDAQSQPLFIRMDHVWVQAWVSIAGYRGLGTGSEDWVYLDPAFKAREYQTGIPDLDDAVVFDRLAFLSSIRLDTPTDAYLDQVRAHVEANFPGQSLADVPYAGRTAPEGLGVLPLSLPYTIQALGADFAEIAPSDRYTVTLQVISGIFGTLLNTTLTLPQYANARLTLGWNDAGAATSDLAKAFEQRDIPVPAYLVDQTPVIRADGVAVSTGSSVPAGSQVTFRATTNNPAGGGGVANHPFVNAGEYAGIGINLDQISDELIEQRTEALAAAAATIGTPSEDDDELLGAFLHLAAMRYFQRVEKGERDADGVFDYVTVRDVAEGLTTADLSVTYLFDRPFAVTTTGMTIDVQLNIASGISIDDDTHNLLALNQLTGLTSSALEHQLWEEFVLIESVSTVKALQVASEDGIPIFTITPANAGTFLPQLNLSAAAESAITSEVLSGRHVVVSRDPILLNKWDGVGYITENPANGTGGFIIFGGLIPKAAGGSTTDDPQDQDPEGDTDDPEDENGTSDDPVIFSNGAMIYSARDLLIPAVGDDALMIERSYSSQLDYDGPLGYGWTHNYNHFVTENVDLTVTYFDGDGGEKIYVPNGVDTYDVPPGDYVELTKNGANWEVRRKHGKLLVFDSTGTLQSITDRNGNTTTLTHTGGLLTSVQDPLARGLTFTYDPNDRIDTIQDFQGRTVTYTYDANGNLETVTDLRGGVHTYVYLDLAYADHNLTDIVDPEGNTTVFEYYANDRAFRLTEAGGARTRFYYSPFHRLTRMIDWIGEESRYSYDAQGNITKVVQPDGGVWTSGWDVDGNRVAVIDQEGNRTDYTYDARRNLLTFTDATGNVATYTYDSNDLIGSIEDMRGNLDVMTRDPAGNLTQFLNAENETTTMEYDSFGRLTRTTDGESRVIEQTYDTNGYPQWTFGALADTTTTSYDPLGRLQRMEDPLGDFVEWIWDDGNDITAFVTQTADSTLYRHDGNGRVKTIRNALSQVHRVEYNPLRRNSRSTDARGAVTEYLHYDPRCDCETPLTTQVIDPLGNGPRYEHDFRRNPTRITDARGNVETRTYDLRGNIASRTDGNGQTTRYEHDGLNRITAKRYADGSSETYGYDQNGNVVVGVNTATQINYAYDRANRLTEVNDLSLPGVLTTTYDQTGNVETVTIPGYGTLTYTWNERNWLESIRLEDGDLIVFTHDLAQFVERVDYPNGTYKEYGYDAAHRITSVTHRRSDTSVISQSSYQFDPVGNRNQITDGGGLSTFQYDPIQQLEVADRPLVTNDESYTYDLAGRRTSDGTQSYAYDENNQLLQYGGTFCTYDGNGNLVTRSAPGGAFTYRYDAEDRLTQVVTPANGLVSFRYDPLSRRTSKTVGLQTRRYSYQGNDLVAEYDDQGTLVAVYVHGPKIDEPLVMIRSGVRTWYHEDGVGSIVAMTDDAENVVQTYQYDAYGNIVAELDPGFENPYTYVGRIFDEETGLYYYRMRYYDATTGRFLTRDPMGHQTGTYQYGYVGNNPVNFIDPFGLARFGKRPLSGMPFMVNSGIDDWLNTEISHEHIFFEDEQGGNTGFGPDGLFEETDQGVIDSYELGDEVYDDATLREAIENVDPGDYSLINPFNKNNCQDYAERVRDEYERLREQQEQQENKP